MNAAQVRAKARMAMKRREEEIEEEEMESGELNLVPYLDIVTNVMLFLLATVTSGLILGTINSALPEYADATGGANAGQDQEPPLQMVLAVTKPEIMLFSLSGQEGTLQAPKLKLPAKTAGQDYDYKAITVAAREIIDRRWADRPVLTSDEKDAENPLKCFDKSKNPQPLEACRPEKATEIFLMVDPEIPYQVVVSVMDAVRADSKDGKVLFPGVIFSAGVQ